MLYALAACQWVHFASTALLFGGSIVREMFHRNGCGWTALLDLRLYRFLLPAALIALLSAFAWLLLEGAEMGGPWSDAIRPHIIRIVLTDTGFGHVWLGRLPLAMVLLLVALRARRASATVAALSAGLLASVALTGHSVMHTGLLGVGHQLNQAVHLVAAGLWLGGLVPLGLLLAASDTPRTDASAKIRALRRFSDVAAIAVVWVLGSGLVNAWMLVGSPSDSDYQITLLLKLGLVGALATVALVNRLVLLPPLAAGDYIAQVRMKRNVKLEMALGALVLAAASVLGNLPPPAMQGM